MRPPRKGPRPPHVYKPKPPREWLAIDGEDIDGHYCLLAASTGERLETPGRSITPKEMCDWLVGLTAAHPRMILVGFGCDYDWQRVLCGLGTTHLELLRDTGETWLTWPGQPYRYKIRHIPGKVLEVTRGTYGGSEQTWLASGYALWCNAWSHFQAPLLEACLDWEVGDVDDLLLVEYWKGLRGTFCAADWERIAAYNDAENRLLVELMERLRASLLAAGLPEPARWHGPGATAKALLRRERMERHVPTPPEGPLEASLRAFYGGRIQAHIIGRHEDVWDYDLASAYPAALMACPSASGNWDYVREWQDDYNWVVYEVEWDVGDLGRDLRPSGRGRRYNPCWPLTPFPWRAADGTIDYPQAGRGWYWAWEVRPALAAWGPERIRVMGGWRLTPAVERPWGWLEELVEERVRCKESDPCRAKALKLAYNSCYGVLAQTVGRAEFHSPVLAGLVTAWTRGRLLDAALRDPEAIVAFATDGLFTSREISGLPLGDKAGDWSLITHGPADIYQAGVYAWWLDGRDRPPTNSRCRGIPRRLIDWAAVGEEWEKAGPVFGLKHEVSHLRTYRQALGLHRPHEAGTWVTDVRSVSAACGWGIAAEHILTEGGRWGTVRILPCSDTAGQVSHVYRRSRFAAQVDTIDEEEQATPDLLEDIR